MSKLPATAQSQQSGQVSKESPKCGSLNVVFHSVAIQHASFEAQQHIKRSEKVYSCLADPLTRRWLYQLNSSTESLDDLVDIVESALSHVRNGFNVCVVGDNQFQRSDHWLRLLSTARSEDLPTRILPSVSVIDCLVADLMIDLTQVNWQCAPASDWLLAQTQRDSSITLILHGLAQVPGVASRAIGLSQRELPVYELPLRDLPLSELISAAVVKCYGEEHMSTLYEPGLYPLCPPRIESKRLKDLSNATISSETMLFVPRSDPENCFR